MWRNTRSHAKLDRWLCDVIVDHVIIQLWKSFADIVLVLACLHLRESDPVHVRFQSYSGDSCWPFLRRCHPPCGTTIIKSVLSKMFLSVGPLSCVDTARGGCTFVPLCMFSINRNQNNQCCYSKQFNPDLWSVKVWGLWTIQHALKMTI